MTEQRKPNSLIRTRIGYYAVLVGAVLNILVIGLLLLTDTFGTPFGVLVIGTMFFIGLVMPYTIDWLACWLKERAKK